MNRDALPHHTSAMQPSNERVRMWDVRPPDGWLKRNFTKSAPTFEERLDAITPHETEKNTKYVQVECDPNGLDAHEPGSKLDAGKPRAHLVLADFARALSAVVEVGTYGAQKYTDHGWCQLPDGQLRYADAAMRHYLARATGDVADSQSGLLHLAHQAWNVLAELELLLRNAETYTVHPHAEA